MQIANQFAENDPLTKALIVVKDRYTVYENYYGDGGINESTNLWSGTKSCSSALVILLVDDNNFTSTHHLMAD